MPGYRIQEWNEENSPMDVEYVKRAYGKKLWAKASNFVRLYALYREGGLYLDTDVEIIRKFDPLMGEDCFLGFQQKMKSTDWVGMGVIGSIAGHPFLEQCISLTLERFNQKGQFYRSPAMATLVLKRMGLREYGLQKVGGVRIYPAQYFYPFPYWESFHRKCIMEDTYSVHYWEATWVKQELPKLKLLLPLARKLRSLKNHLNF